MASTQTTALKSLGDSVAQVKDYLSKHDLHQLTAGAEVLTITDPAKAKIGLRLLKISQLTISEERIGTRLASVYQAVKHLVNSCFLIIQGTKTSMSLYLGVHAEAASTAEKALRQTLTGNFPGIVVEQLKANQIDTVMDRMRSDSSVGLKTVAAVSVVPSERQESLESPGVQGIEKLMDTMQGKEFTAVILATPYSAGAVNQRILALESIYSTLSALEKTTVQSTAGVSTTLTDSIAQTASASINNNMNLAYSCTSTSGTTYQNGKGRGISVSPLGLGISFNRQQSVGFTSAQTQGTTHGTSTGTNIGRSDTASTAVARGSSQSTTVVQTETNKEIQDLLQKIERQLHRLRESEVQGLWDCCGYFVSNANDTAIIAASAFQGIVTGDASNVEQAVQFVWQPTQGQTGAVNHRTIANLTNSLRLGLAPVFSMNGIPRRTESIVTSRELSYMMGLPGRSAGDVAVIHMAEFGRKVHFLSGNKPSGAEFPIGHVTHMGTVDLNTPVHLSIEALNAHMLATGASGVGKTTVLNGVLQEVHRRGIPFTVIEPAKGEYGELWAECPGIDVYSTNPRRYRMLRLNPFAFGEDIPLMEHMDRLICVFSTAWPLYAAQPAILRECVRMAYLHCGWDTRNSICLRPERRFPTFRDVLAELPDVIKRSKFVGENKGTYEGALQTRLKMLTEDIYGEILSSGIDIPDEALFDRSVIIDLSRMGSQETLSLVMGILLIRLYEHRIQSGKKQGLTHMTILEEAHNILKRSFASPQGEDTASVGAKAVEVLTKCITELRFTGEGFLIVDQSPGELDVTAIKNTSTKLVMRLPDAEDQKDMGAALGLSELQMQELGRLDKGSALVMQEGWSEPVLTKLTHFRSPYETTDQANSGAEARYGDIQLVRARLVREVLCQYEQLQFTQASFNRILDSISGFSKWKLRDYRALFARYAAEAKGRGPEAGSRFWYPFFGRIILELLDCGDLFEIFPIPVSTKEESSMPEKNFEEACLRWAAQIEDAVDGYCRGLTDREKKLVRKLLLMTEGGANHCKMIISNVLNKKGASL